MRLSAVGPTIVAARGWVWQRLRFDPGAARASKNGAVARRLGQ